MNKFIIPFTVISESPLALRIHDQSIFWFNHSLQCDHHVGIEVFRLISDLCMTEVENNKAKKSDRGSLSYPQACLWYGIEKIHVQRNTQQRDHRMKDIGSAATKGIPTERGCEKDAREKHN